MNSELQKLNKYCIERNFYALESTTLEKIVEEWHLLVETYCLFLLTLFIASNGHYFPLLQINAHFVNCNSLS